MIHHETPRRQPKPHPGRAECCNESECSTGLRNNYFVGKRLTPDAFRVEQRYLNERRHLLNRAVHGWGVVYGYPVTPWESGSESGRIVIGAGLALDEAGRELLQVDDIVLSLDDVIALDEHGKRIQRDCKETVPPWRTGCWLLSVHYAEQQVGPVTTRDPCSCEHHQWDQVCEIVRFSLQYVGVDCKDCCKPPKCDLCCTCGTGECCKEPQPEEPNRVDDCDDPEPKNPVLRGGCQCLCQHLTHLRPGVECQTLTEIVEPCGHVRVDLHNGVALACVELIREDCEPWKFGPVVESCGPRRLVKRNDVLFDLIRGCDLTRIASIGWARFHRNDTPITWGDFEKSWGAYPDELRDETDYWVEFSRPVREKTVRTDCFAVTVVAAEQEGGWGHMLRVPIIGIRTTPAPNGPSGHVIRAQIRVDADWVRDAICSPKNLFNYQDALVEVEVRGDFIIDCNGQAVDAEAVGLLPVPTGDGAPGGRYLSSFRVSSRRGQAPQKVE